MDDKMRSLTHIQLKVRVMWKCSYKRLLASNKDLRDFAKSRMPRFPQKYPYKVTPQQLLDGVRTGLME